MDFAMFSTWVRYYSIAMIIMMEVSSATNNTANNVIALRKSEYDRLMTLRKNYWRVRTNHDLRKLNKKRVFVIDRNMQRHEIKKCRLRLQNEKDKFEMQLSDIKSEINSLTQYRYLSIVKNQIIEYELYSIDFSPNMELVHQKSDPFNPGAQIEEIRRQRWNHMLENYFNLNEMSNIITSMSEAGIRYTDFSVRIARGYELLVNMLKVNKIDEVNFETLHDVNQTIVGDPQIDKCLLILMKDYEKRGSLYWQD